MIVNDSFERKKMKNFLQKSRPIQKMKNYNQTMFHALLIIRNNQRGIDKFLNIRNVEFHTR